MPLTHFIITRFNLRRTAEDRRPIDHDWLRGRFDLFDRFCYPSVRAQTVQDFRWLVLFDQETPRAARDRIDEYQRWPNFLPVFFPAAATEQARAAVLAHLPAEPRALLATTRLDNDDAICRTLVEDIRKHADVAEPTLIEFPTGYVWHKDRIYLDHQPRNPFTTLVEPLTAGRAFRTIFGASHHDIADGCRVISAGTRPSWIQVIHGGNVANRRRGIRRPLRALGNSFAVQTPTHHESRLALGLDAARTTISTGLTRALRLLRRAA